MSIQPIQLTLPLNTPMKVCSKCHEEKPTSEFAKSRIHKDGLYSSCKGCKAVVNKAYTQANKEVVSKKRHSHYEANKEAAATWGRSYYQANKARINARTTAHGRVNRLRYNGYSKAWQERNKDRVTAQRHITLAAWRAACIAGKKTPNNFTLQQWEELKAKYDHRCLCCGKQEPQIVLSSDHIIPLERGGANDISNIQPLCLPCNRRKHAKTIDYRPSF